MESIVRPVYFCQSYTTPDGELITWKYRPDTAYRGVSIRNAEGVELAFAAYPENKWRITDKTAVTVPFTRPCAPRFVFGARRDGSGTTTRAAALTRTSGRR